MTKVPHPTDPTKTIACDVFHVVPRELLAWTKAHKSAGAKGIGLYLLGQARSLARAAREDGDSARSNYALRVFEEAYDWRLGLSVLRVLQVFSAKHKLPKPFDLCVPRTGPLFARFASGSVVVLEAEGDPA
jgi:hypothetical protein